MRFKFILIVFFFVCCSNVSIADHIVGGEIYYDNLGANNYRITLKLYRDCFSAGAPYDSAATIFVFNSAGTFIDSINIVFPGSVQLPPIINSPCFSPPTNVCVEEAVYQGIVNLPSIPGGYDLVYQRCCRNATILNVISPNSVGSSYVVHIPDNTTAPGNSSPRYNYFPPLFVCTDIPLFFDHSAVDPDGDSLYYELCDPFSGLDVLCPSIGVIAPPGCPGISSPPPYAFIPWQSPYSGTYPMSASIPIWIDPTSGLLTGTPDMIGQWVVGVCVSEFRGGVLIATNKRDFQFNVVDCSTLAVASIPSQTTFCFGTTVTFTQTSVNAVNYQWDFGDSSTLSDTSSLVAPTWTYADTGTYVVTLIVSSSSGCADTATSVFQIYPVIDATFSPPPGECFSVNSFDFSGSGTYSSSATFLWNFGPYGTPTSSASLNPTNIVFSATGAVPISFTVSENGCTVTDTNYISIFQEPNAGYYLESTIACDLQPVHFINTSTVSPLTYEWDFGDGQTSNSESPYHLYPSVGVYLTNLIVTNAFGCSDTFYLSDIVQVFPSPVAGFTVSPHDTSITHPYVATVDTSSGATSCTMYWGDGTSSTPCDTMHTYPAVNLYSLMQVVQNDYGCTDTAYSEVFIYPGFLFWIPNAFTPNGDGINDVFMPKLFGVYDYEFLIFDRWGEKIFETDDLQVGWNGFYKSKLCEQDVYVYKIHFFDEVEHLEHQYIGKVTLVR